jgi:hypothetical protein
MARIIDLRGWRQEHEPEMLRLEDAVRRLDDALADQERADAPEWLVTEVLAIQGCISMELIDEAADRIERVLERWGRRRSAG